MNYLNTDQPYMLFQKAKNGKIYVDKSLLIDKVSPMIGTNNCHNVIFMDLSRMPDICRDYHDYFAFLLQGIREDLQEAYPELKNKNAYLSFLKNLLKDQPYVELAYMTGVLPIAKYSSGSELNMFDEYNFMNDAVYEAYFGFSEQEVQELCEEHAGLITYEELKRWYDGYYLSDGRSERNRRTIQRKKENRLLFWN